MKPFSEYWRETFWGLMGYVPNETQYKITDWWFRTDARFALLLGGERGGKSLTAAAMAGACMGPSEKETIYWVVGPDYVQARPVFAYIYEAFKKGNLVADVSMPNSPAAAWMMRAKTGVVLATRTSYDVAKLASFTVSGFVMDEAAQQAHEAWLKLMGRVSQTRGFGILAGTLENSLPWYQDLYERWKGENELGARSFSLPSWSNVDVYPLGREDPAIKELEVEYPPDLFAERFAAEPRKATGVVIPEFDYEKHVRKLEYIPGCPVELWMDPGTNVYAVLFVQCIGMFTNVLDRVYARNTIVHEVIPEVMGNPLFKHVELDRAGVIDFAGNQRHGNKSQVQLWNELANVSLSSRYIREEVTIETLRYRLRSDNIHHEPLLYFNHTLTNRKSPNGEAMDVLAEFELWKWPKRRATRNEPLRPVDSNNHAMKALGYGLVSRYGQYMEKPKLAPAKQRRYWINA